MGAQGWAEIDAQGVVRRRWRAIRPDIPANGKGPHTVKCRGLGMAGDSREQQSRNNHDARYESDCVPKDAQG